MTKLFIIAAAVIGIGLVACTKARNAKKEKSETTGVKEKGDDIVFLRKIVKGGADKSYGIQVAKLAGVPDSVIARAKEIVEELSANDITEITKNLTVKKSAAKQEKKTSSSKDTLEMEQISLFDTVKDDMIIEELKNLDISSLTPLDALNKLNELQSKAKNRW